MKNQVKVEYLTIVCFFITAHFYPFKPNYKSSHRCFYDDEQTQNSTVKKTYVNSFWSMIWQTISIYLSLDTFWPSLAVFDPKVCTGNFLDCPGIMVLLNP